MKDSRRLIMFRSYALAFAVVLSPVFLQFAYSCERGDTYLLGLEFDVSGDNLIVGFHPDTRSYDVSTGSGTVLLRTDARVATSTVTYQWLVGGTSIESGMIGVDGGDITLDIPDAQSTLRVSVRAVEGNVDGYSINVDRVPGFPTTEEGILDAIATGGGPHFFDAEDPTRVTTSAEIVISQDVILDGSGLLTVSGNDSHRVFSVLPGVTAVIRGFTITGGGSGGAAAPASGFATKAAPGVLGNGIYNEGTLTVHDSVVSDNVGGGIINASTGTLTVTESQIIRNTGGVSGGGIANSGTLTVSDSLIADNASDWNGGIGNLDPPATSSITGTVITRNQATLFDSGGLGLTAGSEVTLSGSTLSDNEAIGGGGAIGAGAGSTLTVLNSTLSGNTAGTSAGGIAMLGTLVLTNSTVAGNSAVVSAGGIGVDATGAATVTSSTIAGNSSPIGSAIGTVGILSLSNTLIEGGCEILGPTPSATYTLESPGSTCSLPAGQGNQMGVGAAALALGPLQDNSGETLTHAPLGGSIALNAIPEAACLDHTGAPLTSDQRGITRPENVLCDIGAIEGYCVDCTDGNECSQDVCDAVAHTCTNPAEPDGTRCDSNAGRCIAAVCQPDFPCTEQGIRDAIAAGGGPHYFLCSGPTTMTTLAEIAIDNDVILDGEGYLTLDAAWGHRVFSVASGVTAELRGFTVTRGDCGSTGGGGGILNQGVLTLTDSVVVNNASDLHGGGIFNSGTLVLNDTVVLANNAWSAGLASHGGGIYSATGAGLTLNDSVVSENFTHYDGGGIYSLGTLTLIDTTVTFNSGVSENNAGGGIYHDGLDPLWLERSTVSNNASWAGAGIVAYSTATTTIIDSTVSNNQGRIYEYGGGIAADVLTMVNSTVSGNFTVEGLGGGIACSALTLVHSTVTGNSASGARDAINCGSALFQNSVIDGACSISGSVTSLGYNIESPGNTCGLNAGTDQANVSYASLGLGPLQDNGGPTFTHAPSSGSWVLDTIPEAACVDHNANPLTVDQRGLTRPENVFCDQGSVEGDCIDCNDRRECTVDSCNPWTKVCSSRPVADGTPCELDQSGPYATGKATCSAGVCGAGTAWGSPVLLDNATTESAFWPVIAEPNNAGETIALWAQESGANRDLWSSRFTPAGGWEPPLIVEAIAGAVQDFDAVIDNSGNAIAVWMHFDGAQNKVRENRSTPAGGWGTPTVLGGELSQAFSPDIVVNQATGDAVAVWSEWETPRYDIRSSHYTILDGWAASVEIDNNDVGNALYPQLVWGIAVWQDSDGAVNTIWSNTFGSLGAWGTPAPVSNGGEATEPQIAAGLNRSIAVWTQNDGVRDNLWANLYTSSAGWGTPELIEHGDGSVSEPDVAAQVHPIEGLAVVVWEQDDDVHANQFTLAGGWGQPTRLDEGDGFADLPRVAMNRGASAVAVWLQLGDPHIDVWASRFTASGGWGVPMLVESQGSHAGDVEISGGLHPFVVWAQVGEPTPAPQRVWANHLDVIP